MQAGFNSATSATRMRKLPDWSRINWDKTLIPVNRARKGVDEAMVWIARGYLKTGRYLIINKRKYEYSQYIGGFGYVASHKGLVKNWMERIAIPEDVRGEKNYLGRTEQKDIYSIYVPPGQSRTINQSVWDGKR